MYPNLPPPTYMGSVWGTVTLSQGEEEHVRGGENWPEEE